MAYKILALDGGGTWALLQAMALQALYGDLPGLEILANFDLAAANSGGSIVLAGLVENKTPTEIITLFSNQATREQIFKTISIAESLLSHLPIFPKYSATGKLAGLSAAFGSAGGLPLADLGTLQTWPTGPNGKAVKILITGFDYDSLRATFFRSYATALGALPNTDTLVDAVHASTNAPVSYFDAPAQFGSHRYWDGAMGGFNNPIMAGVTDLLVEGVAATNIVALSIGTATVKLLPQSAPGPASANVRQQPAISSIITNLSIAAGCIVDDPPDNATFTAHVMLSTARGKSPARPGPVVRLNPVIRPVYENQVWAVPPGLSSAQFDILKNLGMDAVQQNQVDLIATLGAAWIAGTVPNQPIRMASDTLASEPGDETFADGKTRWLAMPNETDSAIV